MTTPDSVRAVNVVVRGRVQGVGYRVAAARSARDLGCSGWVRNASDGSVEVWAQGDGAAIDRLVRFLTVGPLAARVDGVIVTPGVVHPGLATFDIRP